MLWKPKQTGKIFPVSFPFAINPSKTVFIHKATGKVTVLLKPAAPLCVFAASFLADELICILPLWTGHFLSHMMGKTNSTLNQNSARATNMIWMRFKGRGFWSFRTYLGTNW